MEDGRRSSHRFLAPVALVVFGFAFFLVVSGSDVREGDDVDGSSAAAPVQAPDDRLRRERRRRRELPSRVYVVRTGDTLAAIAEKTGLSIERIQTLNPALDPQGLVSGQPIRLRE